MTGMKRRVRISRKREERGAQSSAFSSDPGICPDLTFVPCLYDLSAPNGIGTTWYNDNISFKDQKLEVSGCMDTVAARDWSCLMVHADNKDEVRAIYQIFWPDLWKTMDAGSKLSGETIFSSKTSYGCLIRCLTGYFNEKDRISTPNEIEQRLGVIGKHEDELKEYCPEFSLGLLEKFEKEYHYCFRNFMPFPKASDGKQGLNQFKGSGDYHDYPDRFYGKLSDCYGKDDDMGWDEFLGKCNAREYFSCFKSWKDFVEKNFLCALFEDSEYKKIKDVSPKESDLPYKEAKAKSLFLNDNEGDNEENRRRVTSGIWNYFVGAIEILDQRKVDIDKASRMYPVGSIGLAACL